MLNFQRIFKKQGRYEAVFKKYDPNQPRVPAGNGTISGQWAKTVGNVNFGPLGYRTAGIGGHNYAALDEAVRNSKTPASTLRSQYRERTINTVEFANRLLGPEVASEFLQKLKLADEAYRSGNDTLSRYSKLVDTPSGRKRIWDHERSEQQKKWVGDQLANLQSALPPEGQRPKAVFLAGRGGSGKSTFAIGNTIRPEFGVYDPKKFVTVNPDDMKERIDGYDPELASVVHEESSILATRVMDIALKARANVVVDKTFASDQSENVQKFIDAGYDVEVYMMHLPNVRNVERVIQRWAKRDPKTGRRGRLVPPDVVMNSKKNEQWFDHAIQLQGVKKWGLYTGDVVEGQTPRLLVEGGEMVETKP